MSKRTEEDPVFVTVPEWNLPLDRDGFLAWLRGAGLSLEEFKQMPAWQNAPASLVKSLEPI